MIMIQRLSEADYELACELLDAAWDFLRRSKDTSKLMTRLVEVLDITQLPLPPSEHRSRDLTDAEIDIASDQLEGVRKILGAAAMSNSRVLRADHRLRKRLIAMRGRVPSEDEPVGSNPGDVTPSTRSHPEGGDNVITLKTKANREPDYPILVASYSKPVEYEYRVTKRLLDLHKRDTGKRCRTTGELCAWICSKPARFFLDAAAAERL
jgi:hypothetical protein